LVKLQNAWNDTAPLPDPKRELPRMGIYMTIGE
jgi:hypothetical protein